MNTLLRVLYKTVFVLLLPVIVPVGYVWAARRGEDSDYFERFGYIKLPPMNGPSVWFHCASVGEVRSIAGLIKHLKKRSPELNVIISTMTHTGKNVAMDEIAPAAAFLIPFENGIAVKHLIRTTDTRVFVVVDTELWPTMVKAAAKLVPLLLINGRISAKSYTTYRKMAFMFAPVLNSFSRIFAKSSLDAERFAAVKGSSEGVAALGNLKFIDRKDPSTIPPSPLPEGSRAVFAASTHEPEEQLVIDAFCKARKHADHLVIAPRHVSRVSRAEVLAQKAGLSSVKLSEMDAGADPADVIIVDGFGRLEPFFRDSFRVFVGGSIAPVGGHNIFESLQFETPTAIGPHMDNFHDLAEIAAAHNLTVTVHDADGLARYIADGPDDNADFAGFFDTIGKESVSRRQTITDAIVEAVNRKST